MEYSNLCETSISAVSSAEKGIGNTGNFWFMNSGFVTVVISMFPV